MLSKYFLSIYRYVFVFLVLASGTSFAKSDLIVSCADGLTLSSEFGVNEGQLRYTPKHKIPTLIRGADEKLFRPVTPQTAPIYELQQYDTIVVGGGLAGLTSSIYLTDENKKVLLLEREAALGGLAADGQRGKMKYARGAAYFSPPDLKEYRIFQHIGLGDYKKKFSIHEPIDSYLWGKDLYPAVWEEHSLERLPRSFALFKHALEKLSGQIPIQPIEDSGLLQWDHLSAAEWVRWLPKYVSTLTDAKSKRVYEDFMQDPRVNRNDPMDDVLKFVNLFSRSALGWEVEHVSATAFANFYISEISPRYTGVGGSGDIANRMAKILSDRSERIQVRMQAEVTQIVNTTDGVEVIYVFEGNVRKVRAKRLIFSAPLGLAPRLIVDFDRLAPEHDKILKGLEYAHYSVHNVFVEGHPWRDSYDLWVYGNNYTEKDPTDIILGRWQDKKIDGYLGMRDFTKHPSDEFGILTVYHPLPKGAVGSGYTETQTLELVDGGVERTQELLGPILKEKWGTDLKIKFVETNRWPFSIHIVKPGWLSQARILRRPVGNIYFGNNNLGLPSVEEALYRGHRAAQDALESLKEEPTPKQQSAQK